MGHLLANVNPEAAAEADSGWKPAGPALTPDDDLREVMGAQENPVQLGIRNNPTNIVYPTVGHIVLYHLREGDSRNRRTYFPAIVMDEYPEPGVLKIWVIVDDGDTWMQEHVSPRQGREPGWERVKPGGTVEVSSISFKEIITTIDSLRNRIVALEAKKSPGRPKKV